MNTFKLCLANVYWTMMIAVGIAVMSGGTMLDDPDCVDCDTVPLCPQGFECASDIGQGDVTLPCSFGDYEEFLESGYCCQHFDESEDPHDLWCDYVSQCSGVSDCGCTQGDCPDDPGSGNIPPAKGGSEPGPDGDPCGPVAGEGLHSEYTGGPVHTFYGHKQEQAVDLRVAAGSFDFVFSREYISTPDFESDPLLGSRWTGSAFRFVRFDDPVNGCCSSCSSAGYCNHGCTCANDEWPDKIYRDGSTSQYYEKSTLDRDEQTFPVWTLVEPGQWEIVFYREKESGEQDVDPVDPRLIGLVAEMRNASGQRHEYNYRLEGSGPHATVRLDTVGMYTSDDTLLATVQFEWLESSSDNYGRLSEISVTRDGVPTQEVTYTYADDSTDDDLGTTGDLLQVTHKERVDPEPNESTEQWRTRITQYRYHKESLSPGTGDFAMSGSDHQLKLIVLPEQIEYFAQLKAEAALIAQQVPDDIEGYASDLLALDDEEVETDTSLRIVDLASKIVEEYEPWDAQNPTTNPGRVETQYLLGDCGCAGDGGSRRKMTYEWFTWGDNDEGRTLKVREYRDDSGVWDEYRIIHHDSLLHDDGGDGYPYTFGKVVEDSDSGQQWITYTTYDGDMNPVRRFTPSAMQSYTPTAGGEDPSYQADLTGKVYAYSYTDDNRREETRIGEGLLDSSIDAADALSSYTLVSKRYYGIISGQGEWGASNSRDYLVSKIERFKDEAGQHPEVQEFFYGFYGDNDSSAIAWRHTRVPAETSGQNGPGGTYHTYDLYDESGRLIWKSAADGALTKYVYDSDSGRLESMTRNATATGLPDCFEGLDTTTWNDRHADGGSLTTEYERDLLGRVQRGIAPGAGSTYTRREMRAFPDRPGLTYYAVVTLPHEWSSGDYDGPATITWYNAGGSVIGSSEYLVGSNGYIEPSGSGYLPVFSDYDIDEEEDEVARSVAVHNLVGQRLESTVWHDVDDDASYTTTYAYDSWGRVDYTVDPNGEVRRNQYDIHDRVTAVEIGVLDGSGDPDTELVAEYFYDHELDSGNVVQGVGNGNVTFIRQHADGSSARETEHTYDFRDRLIRTENPLPPHSFTVYDNLDRPVEQATFSSVPNDIDDPVTDRGSYQRTAYSDRGLPYERENAINPSSGSTEFLASLTWYDEVGRPVGQWEPNLPMTKTRYDGLGRTSDVYLVPGDEMVHGDVYASLDVVLGEPVIEQTHYQYIEDDGYLQLVTTRQRMHDVSEKDTGSLNDNWSITTFSGTVYDDAGRPVESVNFGTEESGFESGGAAPISGGSLVVDDQVHLVTTTTYDEQGRVASMTDPEDIVTAYVYDDMDRQVAVIENKVGSVEVAWETDRWEVTYPVGNDPDENRVTSYEHDGAGNLVRQIAHQPSGTSDTIQETLYTYGVTTSDSPLPSMIDSPNVLREIVYPEGQAGSSAADRTVTFAYNRLGEVTHTQDQNGTVHEFHRDDLGRVTADHVTSFAADIDDAVDAIGTQYDDLGRVELVRSYSSFDPQDLDADVANAVEYEYTDLQQVETVIQEPFGDITGTSREVGYVYDNQKLADGNFSRQTTLDYPSAGEIEHFYGTSSSINDSISRLATIDIHDYVRSGIDYHYIGMNMTAVVDYREPDVQLDRTAAADGERNFGSGQHQSGTAGSYPGYDRFGRVVRHMWVDGEFQPFDSGESLHSDSTKPHVPPIYELTHSYDQASNRLTRDNETATLAWGHREEAFDYDDLHRLTEAERSDGTDPHETSRQWDLDMLGNWDSTATWDGSAYGDVETRTHNDANELESLTPAGETTPLDMTFDKVGNMRVQEYYWDGSPTPITVTYTYDAWNRLVEVEYGASTRAEYRYNGLNWRIVKWSDMPGPEPPQQRVMYYNDQWQLLEEFINDDWSASDPDDEHDRRMQYVWGARYIDDIIARRELPAEGMIGTFTLWYHLTDTLFSTVAIIDDAANLVERVSYDAYGKARHHRIADLDGDGDVDTLDTQLPLIENWNDYGIGDINRDGIVNSTDSTIINANVGNAEPSGQLSTTDNIIGYAGYVFNAEMHGGGLYTVRHRVYSPELGRWLTRDPIGYVDGMSLYEYVRSKSLTLLDPTGELSIPGVSKITPSQQAAVMNILKQIAAGTMTPEQGAKLIAALLAVSLTPGVLERIEEWITSEVAKILEQAEQFLEQWRLPMEDIMRLDGIRNCSQARAAKKRYCGPANPPKSCRGPMIAPRPRDGRRPCYVYAGRANHFKRCAAARAGVLLLCPRGTDPNRLNHLNQFEQEINGMLTCSKKLRDCLALEGCQ